MKLAYYRRGMKAVIVGNDIKSGISLLNSGEKSNE
jgi:hypothetical protein